MNICTSSTTPLSQGVPQGLVLSPPLVILYMLCSGNIIRHHSFYFHWYADDIQLDILAKTITTPLNPLWPTASLKKFMDASQLPQTELINMMIIGPKFLTKTMHNFCVTTNISTLSSHSHNVWVILNSHINQITRTAFSHLKHSTSVTLVLHKLHWLSVPYRSQFKVTTTMDQILDLGWEGLFHSCPLHSGTLRDCTNLSTLKSLLKTHLWKTNLHWLFHIFLVLFDGFNYFKGPLSIMNIMKTMLVHGGIYMDRHKLMMAK